MANTVAPAIRSSLRENRQQPGSPHTPTRFIPSNYSSPGSAFRQEEDAVIFELDPRYLSAGFEGESGPQCTISFSPHRARRLGDYREWMSDYKRKSENIEIRSKDYELWRNSVKDLDLGLLEDRLERGVREAYNKHLLTDAGTARLVVVLPSLVPHPVLSTVLTLLFERWKYTTITLLPAPTMAALGAGLRSALVVDIGWEETVITPVYEYRELQTHRTRRGMKSVTCSLGQVLETIKNEQEEPMRSSLRLDFDMVEEILTRTACCNSLLTGDGAELTAQTESLTLDQGTTPVETGEVTAIMEIDWPTNTSYQPVNLAKASLHDAVFGTLLGIEREEYRDDDDDEHTVPYLLYQVLLALSPDIRGVCMSRIIFTGQGSNICGLSARTLKAVDDIIQKRGWTSVCGQHVKSQRTGLAELAQGRVRRPDAGHDTPLSPGKDFVEERLQNKKSKEPAAPVKGILRQVDSLGAWSGASLLTSLKIRGFVEIDRERFLSHGLSGAHRDADVSVVPQRMSSFGLPTAKSGDRTSWTLAGWG